MARNRKIAKNCNPGEPKQRIKRKYFIYTSDMLQEALSAVQKGMCLRTASKRFGIPFSTLRNKHKGIYSKETSGPATILSSEEEKLLVQWILDMEKRGFPFTRDMLFDSVQMLVLKTKRENPFKNNRPGRSWFEGFMRRHKELSERTPQNLCDRRSYITEEKLRQWFSEVEAHLKEKNLLDIDGSRVFNCGEAVFFLNPKDNKVIANKTSKVTYSLIGADENECLTTLITGNAVGQILPPMVMYAYKRLPSNIVEKVPKGWNVVKSENGWMTGESFFEYMTDIFYPWCQQSNIQFPIIMYIDAHSSHATMELSNFCIEKQIELVSLCPNSIYVTQPMDETFFGPLKEAWKTAVMNYRIDNNGESLNKSDFAPVLKVALDSIDTEKVLVDGFAACGLAPFSVDAVDYSKLLKSEDPISTSQHTQPYVETSIDSIENTSQKIQNALECIETIISPSVLELFQIAESQDQNWHGEEKYQELFYTWLQCRHNLILSEMKKEIDPLANY